MRKKYGRIAVFLLGCLLAVWGLIIYPILNRGSVAVTFSNTSHRYFTVVRINEQVAEQPLEAGGSCTVKYFIQKEEPLVVYLKDENGTAYEQEITDSFTGPVNPKNYGRALVTIKEKKGELELKVLNNISK